MMSHRSGSRRRILGLAAAAATAVLVSGGAPGEAAKPATPAATAKTRSFVVTYFWNSMQTTDKECPTGLNPPPDKEAAISKLPADQQDAYRKDEAKSLRILSNRGPKGENVCLAPTLLPDPGFKLSQSPVQDGFDLEKAMGPGRVCKQVQVKNAFESGVDNQLSRVLGCIQHRRHDGFFPKYFVNQMRSGEYTYLIEITGIDDERNDPEVQVLLSASEDPIVLDTTGAPLSDASLQVTANTEYRHTFKGRIVDGVLTTAAKDRVRLPFGSVFPTLDITHAMMRLTFQPDGGVEGTLGGYQDWREYYKGNVSGGGIAETSGGPFQCTGLYYALKNAADGDRDPKTGECASISSAYRIEGVPAFAIHANDVKVAGTR